MKLNKIQNCIRCGNPFNANLMMHEKVCGTCERMNCITFWYPKLQRLGFPMPKTVIVYTDLQLNRLLEEETIEGVDAFVSDLRHSATKVGLHPVFLRTGYLSNKHDWDKSCFIDLETMKDKEKVLDHVKNIVEMSELADISKGVPTDFWAVREFIETEKYFNYFAGNMPITKERRYFVRNGKIECHHNYWDRKAFNNDIDEDKFNELQSLSEEDEKILDNMALYVANLFSGYWSVDFLKGENGQWYMTDMAIGERSYHQNHEKTNL